MFLLLRVFLRVWSVWRGHPMVRKSACMDSDLQAHAQPNYLPAIVPIVGTVKHSLRKLAVALS